MADRINSTLRSDLWTTNEVAEALGYHPVWVRKLVAAKKVGSVRIGARRFIPQAALVRYLVDLTANPDTRESVIALVRGRAASLGVPFDEARLRAAIACVADGMTVTTAPVSAEPVVEMMA